MKTRFWAVVTMAVLGLSPDAWTQERPGGGGGGATNGIQMSGGHGTNTSLLNPTLTGATITSGTFTGNGAGVTNVSAPFAQLLYPTINTNQFVLSGLTNGVPPSTTVAYLNGLVWTWNGHSYTSGTNGIYYEPNYQGAGAFWLATNSGYHDIVTPSILFVIGSSQQPIFPGNGTVGNSGSYSFSDGTINANSISGGGNFLTNGTSSNPILAFPPPLAAQPGMSNAFALITPEMFPYNAVGDGIANDYQAVQSAINDCAASGVSGPYPRALFLSRNYYMGTNSLNITPVAGNGGLRIFGNNAALQGVPNSGASGANRNGTLIWTNGVKHAGIICTNSGSPNNTATIISGVNLVGPNPGNPVPVAGTVAMDLTTSGAAQFKIVDSQFNYWDTVIVGTNCYDLTIYNASASVCSNCMMISAAQNLSVFIFNAFPQKHGITLADGSTGTIYGLDFAPPSNTNYSLVVTGSSHVDLLNANFDQGGCVYNDGSLVNVMSCRQGSTTARARWISTNCGQYELHANAGLLPDSNNVSIAAFNCSSTNLVVMEGASVNGVLLTNATLGTTNRYIWPGFR